MPTKTDHERTQQLDYSDPTFARIGKLFSWFFEKKSYSCCAITIDNLNTSKHHPDFDGADIFDIFHLPIVKYQACFDFLLLTRCPICQQCIYHPLSVETCSKHAPRKDKNIWILYTSVFVDICRHFPPQGPRDVER